MLFPSFKKRQAIWPEAGGQERQARRDRHGARQGASPTNSKQSDRRLARARAATYFSQSIDTAALEPDNANCWYDEATQALHMVRARRSRRSRVAESVLPNGGQVRVPGEGICSCIRATRSATAPRITCNFPFYGLIAALYGEGHPVRLANDRFEQFQTSLKRHSIRMRYTMAVDRKTGLIQSFKGDFDARTAAGA